MEDGVDGNEMPLTDAALRLRITYASALRRMLRGELRGHRVDGRFWFVCSEDVDRLAKEMRRTAATANRAGHARRVGDAPARRRIGRVVRQIDRDDPDRAQRPTRASRPYAPPRSHGDDAADRGGD